jgi:hypothetical protein
VFIDCEFRERYAVTFPQFSGANEAAAAFISCKFVTAA